MMVTSFVLTILVGLVVSMGALVSVGSGIAWAGNWNLSADQKAEQKEKKELQNRDNKITAGELHSYVQQN